MVTPPSSHHAHRVLLERLIVNRPHPWGLLITFIELIKNPRYAFWSHDFTRCAPDIEVGGRGVTGCDKRV
jgi:CCR4-NOT transcription complex subunit 1